MDTGTLRNHREARRRAVRRLRQAAGLFVATIIALVAVVLVSRSGGASQATRDAASARGSAGAHQAGPRSSTGTASANTAANGARAGSGAIPVLMYHVIAAPPPGAPFPGLYVSPSELAAQVQA